MALISSPFLRFCDLLILSNALSRDTPPHRVPVPHVISHSLYNVPLPNTSVRPHALCPTDSSPFPAVHPLIDHAPTGRFLARKQALPMSLGGCRENENTRNQKLAHASTPGRTDDGLYATTSFSSALALTVRASSGLLTTTAPLSSMSRISVSPDSTC